MSFWQLFLRTYIRKKAAEKTTYVQKIRTYNVDEIDTSITKVFFCLIFRRLKKAFLSKQGNKRLIKQVVMPTFILYVQCRRLKKISINKPAKKMLSK